MKKKLLLIISLIMLSLCGCIWSGESDGGLHDVRCDFNATIDSIDGNQLSVTCLDDIEEIKKGTKITIDISEIAEPTTDPAISKDQIVELSRDELTVGKEISISYFSGALKTGSHPTCRAAAIYPVD